MNKLTRKFISIEGIEGAGKSTALVFIKNYFEQKQLPFVLTREPGGTPLAEEIRCLLLHHQAMEIIHADTELLLMFAARAQHIHQVILPALNNNQFVISDRYIDASYAYQGGGRNIPMQKIQQLTQIIVDDVQPVLTILLDVSTTVGMERAEKRNVDKDRIEQESLDFFERVRQVYLQRAQAEPNRIKIVNANVELNNVNEQLKQILDTFIAGHQS